MWAAGMAGPLPFDANGQATKSRDQDTDRWIEKSHQPKV